LEEFKDFEEFREFRSSRSSRSSTSLGVQERQGLQRELGLNHDAFRMDAFLVVFALRRRESLGDKAALSLQS